MKDLALSKNNVPVATRAAAKSMLMQDAAGGDVATAAVALGVATAASTVAGVIVNQAGRQASDTAGRKCFLLAGPVACIFSAKVEGNP